MEFKEVTNAKGRKTYFVDGRRTADIPNWAMSYLINNDASGLTDEDKDACDEWWCAMKAEGYSTVSPTDETNEFCAYPEFGLACDTTKCEIIKWKEN